jgi:cell division protease FtsH
MVRRPNTPPAWMRAALVAMVGMAVVRAVLSLPQPVELSYSDFRTLVERGKVNDLTLDRQTVGGQVTMTGLEGLLPAEQIQALARTSDHRFSATRVDDPGLVPELRAARIRFTGGAEAWLPKVLGWVLPTMAIMAVWMFVMRRGGPQGGLLALGKSRAKVYVEQTTGVSFDDVAGIDEARHELMEIVDFLRRPARYQRLGGRIPKGVLLVGAPGTGKTLLAKAVAGEAGVPFFSLSGSDFIEMIVGVGAARVRDLFAQAQAKAPSIVFIDELDALGKARGMNLVGGHDEREQTLNQLLTEMDGFDTTKGIIIMAATNRPEILDPALLRPGRFDRKVVVDRPDLKGRETILRVHTRGLTLASDLDLALVAARTPGFVGADLANLANEAALAAARRGKEAVGLEDFDEAIDRVVAGLERKSRVMSSRERDIVAYHEAGHALIAQLRPHADPVHKVSIIPRGVAALGYTQQRPTADRYLMTRAELLDRLDVLLGGRVAEELTFGEVSTGAQDDLQRATDIARHMITRWGMSETLGLGTFEEQDRAPFLPGRGTPPREYSEDTARAIDAEIRRFLDGAHDRVLETLTARRTALETLAKLLIDHEVVDGEQLSRLVPPSH